MKLGDSFEDVGLIHTLGFILAAQTPGMKSVYEAAVRVLAR